jgi:hypothetical protein
MRPLLALLLSACVVLLGGRARAADVEFALLSGWARVVTLHGTTWLTPQNPGLLVERGAYFELGPDCRLEVVDIGRASLVFEGTTSAELRRRDDGSAELPDGQRLGVARSVVHLFGDPLGGVFVENLLGAPLELDLGGWYTFELAVGTRRVLPARLDGAAAARRRADFQSVVPTRGPRPLPPLEEAARGGVHLPGTRVAGGLEEQVRRMLLDASRGAQAGLRQL